MFNSSPAPTLGVELELQIVDGETLDHIPMASEIIDKLGHPLHIKHELFESTVEINTAICETATEAKGDLQANLDRIYEVCDARGWAVISSGTHPFADWQRQVISPNPRYHRLLERIQLPVRKLVIFGTHFHIGVSDPEKAIAIQNSLRTFLPHFLALSASSPYWEGADAGMASSRTNVFDVMPTAGIPFELHNWNQFLRYAAALEKCRAIEGIREIWTDIRPHPDFGTIELRICDASPTLTEVTALAAMAQSLVVYLGNRYDNGEELPRISRWIVRENKWRAARFGIDADLVVDDVGSLKPLVTSIRELIRDLTPTAVELGCDKELDDLHEVITRGPSYVRQREVLDRTENFGSVVATLAEELRTDRMLPVA